jgi:Transposase DDE domain
MLSAQAAVDTYRQIIVACDVTDASNDMRQLRPMLDLVRQTAGRLPEEYSADTGYWSAENVTTLEQHGVDAYIPPKQPPRRPDGAPSASPPTPLTARMQAKLKTPQGKQTYSLRKETAEPVFGQMKDGRGLRRFRTRGLAKVRGEWALWCLTHNLLKLASVFRAQRLALGAAIAAQIGHDPYLVVPDGLLPKTATTYGMRQPFAPITRTTACGFAGGRPVRSVAALSATNARSSVAFPLPALVSQTGS